MKTQLLLSKRLYREGCEFADRGDPASSGLAISLFQDAVEMFVWAIIKDRDLPAKDAASFTANLDALQKSGIDLKFVAKLRELNKARVGFKHYGNLPAPSEASKFRNYVEEFLRVSFTEHFGEDFDGLSIVDLVPFDDVRAYLKAAEAFIANAQYPESASEAAIAKVLLFSKLDKILPKVARDLRNVDSVFNRIPEIHGLSSFRYLAEYLEMLREAALASLIRMPLDDYSFIRKSLPDAFQYANGKWEATCSRYEKYDESLCRRAIDCLIDLSLRLARIV